MTLLQMRYILEVERCGSMNRAAQDLFISQSALSTAILEVEKELGITIFRRSNRGVVLTEDGRELVMQIADRVLVLEYGSVLAEGTPSEVQSNRRVIDAYLGGQVQYAVD